MQAVVTKGSLWLPLVLSIAVAGCASATDDSTQQELAQLRKDVDALNLSAHRTRGESETLLSQMDRRSREQAAESTRQTNAINARIEALSTDLNRLSARVDELNQRLDNLSRSGGTTPGGSGSLSSGGPSSGGSSSGGGGLSSGGPSSGGLSSGGPSGSGSSGGSGSSTSGGSSARTTPLPAPTPGPPRSSNEPGAEESYKAAYSDFTKGNYTLAVAEFREFVRRYPDSPKVDSAQYWIGECYFNMGRAAASAGQPERSREALERSVQEFRKVFVNYPNGSQVPTALYKEALALVELKQPKVAQARLQYIVDNFPQSEEAPLARERLKNLGE
ncbi:MAG TPA: tetratricopeptide repeat protein [Methylomirabilota bacterium]|nr:tetratricopeptide repeat protein [Methylomirabilota bacterium]